MHAYLTRRTHARLPSAASPSKLVLGPRNLRLLAALSGVVGRLDGDMSSIFDEVWAGQPFDHPSNSHYACNLALSTSLIAFNRHQSGGVRYSKSHAQRQALPSQLNPGETLAPLIAFPESTKHPFTLPLITLWIRALTHLFTSLRTLEPRGAVLFLDVRWQMQMVSLL